MVFSLG